MDALTKLQQGARSTSAGDSIDYSYYATVKINQAVLTHRLFTQQVGGALSFADTNMKTASFIPQGQALLVRALKLNYITTSVKNTASIVEFYKMLANTTLQFLMSGKDDYGTWTLAELFQCGVYYAITPTAAGDNIPFINAPVKPIYPLNFSIPLPALQTFECVITHHVAPAQIFDNDLLKVSLNGKLDRLA